MKELNNIKSYKSLIFLFVKRLRSWLKANLILSYYEHMKKRERSAINITCSKYLVLHKREADGAIEKQKDEMRKK